MEAFAEAPNGRYFAGSTFAHFCADDALWGVVLWGRPTSDDMALLVRSLHIELTDVARPHRSIVDARRLDSVDVSAFAVLDGYVRDHQAELSEKVTELSLLRPAGMAGAVVAGFFEVLPKPYPVLLLESAPEEDLLMAVFSAASGAPPIVMSLRAVIGERLTSITIADASRALGMSERTLQRRLRSADTSFLDELNAARVRAAQRLLLDSDEPVTTVALEVGCATPQHFSTLFRKLTGESPSQWRADRRSGNSGGSTHSSDSTD